MQPHPAVPSGLGPFGRPVPRLKPWAIFRSPFGRGKWQADQVNLFDLNRLLRKRYLVAALAGLLWAAAFPKMWIAGLAWIAPGVMLAAALGSRGGEAFR